MKLKIEEWSEKNLTDNAKVLMGESILCYKVGAYRSAYLMSYLAFKQTIRERIMTAPAYPDCYSNNIEWDRCVLNLLRNDEKWEDTINEIVTTNKAGNKLKEIFVYRNREKTLNRYEYWKNTRNSCAHAKDEIIDSATVEHFWNYIQDDMSEYYVLGGEKYLLDELSRRHKYYACDTDKDISRLLNDIGIVYKNKLKEFFYSFLDGIKKEHRDIVNEVNCDFWKDIVFSKEDSIREAFALNVSKDEVMFLNFFKYYPDILQLIVNSNARFMQDSVNELLCNKLSSYYGYNEYLWKLLVCALKIQPTVLEIDKITGKYENLQLIENIQINQDDENILNQYCVFEKFITNAGRDFFINDATSQWQYYQYGNIKKDKYVIECFNHLEWDMEIIQKLEQEYEALVDNIDCRGNSDSRYNGKKRLKAYEEIVEINGDKIRNVV